MARTISYMQAINEALAQEMERDETVVVFGEDNVEPAPAHRRDGRLGQKFMGVTKGSWRPVPGPYTGHPDQRIRLYRGGVRRACSGFVLWRSSCSSTSSVSAWTRSTTRPRSFAMFGGKAKTPMVIRTMFGAGIRAASQHSQSLYPIFTHIPGLKVVVPSNPYDAKGLLIA